MGRRTNEQICIDLRKERARLYSKRSRILKMLQNKKLKSKKREEADNDYKKVENRLEEIKDKLFRCGKKYSRLKKQRNKLRRHQYYLQSKTEKIREKMLEKGLTKKEKAALKKELNIVGRYKRQTAEEIQTIEKAMQLPTGVVSSSSGIDRGVVSVSGGKFVVQDVLWKLAESWNKWLSSGYFTTLVLDDEIFDVEDNPMIATAAIYQAYDWALAWQHVYGTPFFFAFGDAANGYLEIKVKEYTSDMYAGEIEKHKGDIEQQ